MSVLIVTANGASSSSGIQLSDVIRKNISALNQIVSESAKRKHVDAAIWDAISKLDKLPGDKRALFLCGKSLGAIHIARWIKRNPCIFVEHNITWGCLLVDPHSPFYYGVFKDFDLGRTLGHHVACVYQQNLSPKGCPVKGATNQRLYSVDHFSIVTSYAVLKKLNDMYTNLCMAVAR